MSLLPEFIFRTIIVRGIRTIRQDTRLLDQLFRNLDLESAQQMREFIRTQKIYIDINYPREDLKLPAIIILLRAESEAQAFLSDSMGVGQIPDSMSYDSMENSEEEVLGGAASVSTLSGEGPIVFGPFRASGGTNNTLSVAERTWSLDQFMAGGVRTVHILSGTGVGQQRNITANGPTAIMVRPNWSTIPDATTVFVIRDPVSEVVGEPRTLYAREGANHVERLGSIYNLSYQVQVIGPNPEMTIYLAAIVKAIFTLARQYLEGQGIMVMKLGATDFIPRAEYQPEHAYMRALNVDFQYPFDVFAELGDLASSFRIALECGLEGEAEVVSDTTI